ncbi:MAG: DUF1570 domain-containing protein [Planctomycetaceae bacterium]|jgi:hypothetical protein|nr:DUF1570 domain-containing protein [Planctomycetaceae bacterium]
MTQQHSYSRNLILFALFVLLTCLPVYGLDTITFKEVGGGLQRTVVGRIVVEAGDALILEGRDGQIFVIRKTLLIDRKTDDIEFSPMTMKELEESIKSEFPDFSILKSDYYLIAYNTSPVYAKWVKSLLERLRDSLGQFWRTRGVPLKKPQFPLVAIVFASKEQFARYAISEIGSDNMAAYYNRFTNRIILADLTSIESNDDVKNSRNKKLTSAQLENLLNRPAAAFNIATVIHEATHQVAFNGGMHDRLALSSYPLWVIEGIAVMHEVPDRDKKIGWGITLKPNDYRFEHLIEYWRKRPDRAFDLIIKSDKMLRNPKTALDAYALAWGLVYFLVTERKVQFTTYLQKLAKKDVTTHDTQEQRMSEFEECFGDDWDKLYQDFTKSMNNIAKKIR